MQNFLFTSDIFKGSRYEKGHPLDMDRVWPSVELIRLMGWVKEDQIIKNSPADSWVIQLQSVLVSKDG